MTWTFQFTTWALPGLLAVLFAARLLDYLWPRRRERGSLPLIVLMAATGWWSLFHLLAVVNIGLDAKLAAHRLGMLGGALVPPAILWFGLALSGKGRHLKRAPFILFSLVSMSLAGMAFMDAPAGWFWSNPRLTELGGIVGLVLDRGPGFWVETGLRMAAALLAGALLLRHSVKQREKLGVAALMLAVVLAILIDLRTLIHPDWPLWMDLTSDGITLATVIITAGLLHARLLHVGPVARSLIVERMRDIVLVLDRKGQIVDLNQAAQVVLGLEPYGEIPVPLGTLWASARMSPGDTHRLDLATGEEETRTFEVTLTPMDPLEESGRIILVLRDMTDREIMERELEEQKRALERANIDLNRQANTDGLTDLPNRRHFMDQLDREMERVSRYERPLAVVMMDLDHFKEVNDTFGHAIGDDVLVATADVLRSICRDTDMPGRLGGEEFGVILPETDEKGAHILAERIRMGVERRLHHANDSRSFQVTTSLGVATLTEDRNTAEKLLHAADEALYHAKDEGRNQVVMAPLPPDQQLDMLRIPRSV